MRDGNQVLPQTQKKNNASSSTKAIVDVKKDKTTKMVLFQEIPSKTPKPIIVNKNINKSNKQPIRSNARVSDYMGLEKEIIKRTVSGKIPSSLPKHIEGQNKEQYQLILKSWAKENLNLIKKEFHAKTLKP